MSTKSSMTAGRTRDFKQIVCSREDHDRIALLAIEDDETLAEITAKALAFYFEHRDRLRATKKSKRA